MHSVKLSGTQQRACHRFKYDMARPWSLVAGRPLHVATVAGS